MRELTKEEKNNSEFWNFLNIFLEKNKHEIKSIEKFEVKYLSENMKYEIRFIKQINMSGNFIYLIQFPLDFGSVQKILDIKQENSNNHKINLLSDEDRNLLAQMLSDKFDNFTKFIEYVGFFNSHKDYCDEIADFIINSKGAIVGKKFGL